MNVLFVEDSLLCQELVKRTTEKEFPFVRLTCVGTLTEARKLVEDADVVVLDLGLPDAEHDEVYGWITECNKPVVIYTGSTEPEVAFQAVNAGALNIVCKGSPAEQLVMGMYVAMAEHNLQKDQRLKRQEAALQLHQVLNEWCADFNSVLTKNGDKALTTLGGVENQDTLGQRPTNPDKVGE